MERETNLRDLGYKVVSITSCEGKKREVSKIWYQPQVADTCNIEDILDSVKNDEIIGFVLCSLHIPDHQIDRFSDFPPICKNTEITLADIGEECKNFAELLREREV